MVWLPCHADSGDAGDVVWVQCDNDTCMRWFHAVCVRYNRSADDEWLCEACVAAASDVEDEDTLALDA